MRRIRVLFCATMPVLARVGEWQPRHVAAFGLASHARALFDGRHWRRAADCCATALHLCRHGGGVAPLAAADGGGGDGDGPSGGGGSGEPAVEGGSSSAAREAAAAAAAAERGL